MIREEHQAIEEKSVAIYSDCRQYRYWLERTWDSTKKPVAFIGLNPSTATAMKDDPTLRRCRSYATQWGFGGLIMLNAFAYRSTDPRGLTDTENPIGDATDQYIMEGVFQAQQVIACWGNHATLLGRDLQLRGLLKGKPIHCLKITGTGQPGHPLYLRADAQRTEWSNE